MRERTREKGEQRKRRKKGQEEESYKEKEEISSETLQLTNTTFKTLSELYMYLNKLVVEICFLGIIYFHKIALYYTQCYNKLYMLPTISIRFG